MGLYLDLGEVGVRVGTGVGRRSGLGRVRVGIKVVKSTRPDRCEVLTSMILIRRSCQYFFVTRALALLNTWAV